MDHRIVFVLPVLLACGLLVLHSWRYRGARATVIYWGIGYLIYFAREYIYQNHLSHYQFAGLPFQVLGVPPVIPLGWLFSSYTSLHLAQVLLGKDLSAWRRPAGGPATARAYGEDVLPVIVLASIISGTIAFAIENVAVNMGWWGSAPGVSPVMKPWWILGYAIHNYWFLHLVFFLTWQSCRLPRVLVHVALIWGWVGVQELHLIDAYPVAGVVAALALGAWAFFWRESLAYGGLILGLALLASPLADAFGVSRDAYGMVHYVLGLLAYAWLRWLRRGILAPPPPRLGLL